MCGFFGRVCVCLRWYLQVVSELTRGFFLLFSFARTHTHTGCSAMKRRQAVTGQGSASHIQSHGHAHTCAYKLTGAPANQLKHCILTLLQYLLLTDCRRETFTHTHSLSKHFPEACGRETFTGIRFQPGPQPTLRQKCAYSISIYTHTHTHTHIT